MLLELIYFKNRSTGRLGQVLRNAFKPLSKLWKIICTAKYRSDKLKKLQLKLKENYQKRYAYNEHSLRFNISMENVFALFIAVNTSNFYAFIIK